MMKKITLFTLILLGISCTAQAAGNSAADENSLVFLTPEEEEALQKEIEQQKRSFDLDEDEDEDEMDQDIDPEQQQILNVLLAELNDQADAPKTNHNDQPQMVDPHVVLQQAAQQSQPSAASSDNQLKKDTTKKKENSKKK